MGPDLAAAGLASGGRCIPSSSFGILCTLYFFIFFMVRRFHCWTAICCLSPAFVFFSSLLFSPSSSPVSQPLLLMRHRDGCRSKPTTTSQPARLANLVLRHRFSPFLFVFWFGGAFIAFVSREGLEETLFCCPPSPAVGPGVSERRTTTTRRISSLFQPTLSLRRLAFTTSRRESNSHTHFLLLSLFPSFYCASFPRFQHPLGTWPRRARAPPPPAAAEEAA